MFPKLIQETQKKSVDDFNMEIQDGEFIVFVGPSGCGKSTTLRMIAGLEDITDGELYIDGKYMNDVEPKDRNIAMVFQNYALYPYLSVYDNIAFGLKLRKVPKAEIDKKVHEAAKILGIEEYLKRKPKALSGGQRQRVAVGRAIVRDANIYLFDEPLSNLDAKLRTQMRVEIIRLYEKLKTTFVYVTHDQVEAMTMGTRIVVMKDGIVQQIDTPTNLYDYPVNKFVAGFIGTPQMNFIDAKYIDSQLTIGSKTIDLTKEFLANQDVESLGGGNVCVGIRPRSVKVMDQEGYDEKYAFEGTVNVSEQLGDEVLLYLTVEGKDGDFTIAGNPKKQYKIGDKVKFSINPNEIHLFNPVTEKTLYISK